VVSTGDGLVQAPCAAGFSHTQGSSLFVKAPTLPSPSARVIPDVRYLGDRPERVSPIGYGS
jgi:hypothetical protein